MTAKQYYRQTSNMAYPLESVYYVDGKVVGNIVLRDQTPSDGELLLKENDFFALPVGKKLDVYEFDDEFDGFELRIHYGVDDYDCYEMSVCDIIDCTCVEGGSVVLSCDGYKLLKSYRPTVEKDKKDEKENDDSVVEIHTSEDEDNVDDDIEDVFTRVCKQLMKYADTHGSLFARNAFDGLFDKLDAKISSVAKNDCDESDDNDGNSRFYEFSCRIEPDGKVHLKRRTNEGTVEKNFTIGKDDGKCVGCDKAVDAKTKLKNLVK